MDNFQSNLPQKAHLSPMDFFMHLGFVVALVTSVVSFLSLAFRTLERLMPDPLNQYYYASSAMQSAIAFLIISFPILVLLNKLINKSIKQHPEKAELGLRKWMLYGILFISGLIILGDIITLIRYFLMGDLGALFISKILVVLLIGIILFVYFIHELTYKNIWSQKSIKIFEWVSVSIFLAGIVTGFCVMGSPKVQRQIRFDDQRVSNLQSIQWQIINYYQQRGVLPKDLTSLNDPLSSYAVPVDPNAVSGNVYEYSTGKDKYSFTLCATFDLSTMLSNKYKDSYGYISYDAKLGSAEAISSRPVSPDAKFDNWMHESGKSCFDRTIDPVRYPLYSKN